MTDAAAAPQFTNNILPADIPPSFRNELQPDSYPRPHYAKLHRMKDSFSHEDAAKLVELRR